MVIYTTILRRNIRLSNVTYNSHFLRFHSTKQLQLPVNHLKQELKSKLNATLPTPPTQFKIICILTGTTIAGSTLIFLREKLLFGTIGGVTAKTLTAPLERLTVFRQASVDFKSSIALIVTGILNEEGLKGFWRGNGINVFRASIQKGSLFALQDFFRELLTHGEKERLKQSLGLSFVAGWMAGLTSTLITFPLDTIKTVNQSTIHQKQWPAIRVWYSLAKARGIVRGPWVAALPTCIGASFYYAIKFMAFDACLMGIGIMSNRYEFEIQRDVKNAVGGLCAGVIGNLCTYPNNCIRKRMQTAHVCEAIGIQSAYPAQSYVNTGKQFYYHEGGFSRFYKGFGINLLRNAPNTAIQFVVYKRLQSLWSERHATD